MVLYGFDENQRRVIRFVAYRQKVDGFEIIKDAELSTWLNDESINDNDIEGALSKGVDEGIIERYVGFNNQGMISDYRFQATYFPVKKDVVSSINACRILPDKLGSVIKYFGGFGSM